MMPLHYVCADILGQNAEIPSISCLSSSLSLSRSLSLFSVSLSLSRYLSVSLLLAFRPSFAINPSLRVSFSLALLRGRLLTKGGKRRTIFSLLSVLWQASLECRKPWHLQSGFPLLTSAKKVPRLLGLVA